MTAPNAIETGKGRDNPLEAAQPHGYDQTEFDLQADAPQAGPRPAARPRLQNEEARHLRAARADMDSGGPKILAGQKTHAGQKNTGPSGSGKWDHEDDRVPDGRARLYRD